MNFREHVCLLPRHLGGHWWIFFCTWVWTSLFLNFMMIDWQIHHNFINWCNFLVGQHYFIYIITFCIIMKCYLNSEFCTDWHIQEGTVPSELIALIKKGNSTMRPQKYATFKSFLPAFIIFPPFKIIPPLFSCQKFFSHPFIPTKRQNGLLSQLNVLQILCISELLFTLFKIKYFFIIALKNSN